MGKDDRTALHTASSLPQCDYGIEKKGQPNETPNTILSRPGTTLQLVELKGRRIEYFFFKVIVLSPLVATVLIAASKDSEPIVCEDRVCLHCG